MHERYRWAQGAGEHGVAHRTHHDELMRYLDGEAAPDERERIEVELDSSTELQRELALFRAMKEDFMELTFQPVRAGRSVWDQVNRKLARPVEWMLLLVGIGVWSAYGIYLYAAEPRDLWQKLATGAMVIGIVLLLSSVIWERYREWLTDPYRDVHR